jgi:hypothetical protein
MGCIFCAWHGVYFVYERIAGANSESDEWNEGNDVLYIHVSNVSI